MHRGAGRRGSACCRTPECDWALALADFWNEQIEAWTTVSGTELARQYDIPGYYLRVAPPGIVTEAGASTAIVPIRNRVGDGGLRGDQQIGTEFLQLVRFGLRRADDPLILGSLKLADALLRTDTPTGPVWHRYLGDGYGEHEDGRAFDGTGIGRGWPLLTGERGHYEIEAGNDPLPYLAAMAAMASPGGMIPEQVWDAEPIQERRLFPGGPAARRCRWPGRMPSSSSCWCRGRSTGRSTARARCGSAIADGARSPNTRSGGCMPRSGRCAAGARLAVALPFPAVVRWGRDGWQQIEEVASIDSGLGFDVAVLDTAALRRTRRVDFTWRRQDNGEWAGRDVVVLVKGGAAA